jgi:hypothetical protein
MNVNDLPDYMFYDQLFFLNGIGVNAPSVVILKSIFGRSFIN